MNMTKDIEQLTSVLTENGQDPAQPQSEQEDQSTQMLKTLVESVLDYAIIFLDPAGRVLTWSVAAERLTGWKAEEIIGQHCSRFHLPENIENDKLKLELEAA